MLLYSDPNRLGLRSVACSCSGIVNIDAELPSLGWTGCSVNASQDALSLIVVLSGKIVVFLSRDEFIRRMVDVEIEEDQLSW